MPVAHGRVALVTGSSRGLGAEIARRLAEDGLAVAVNAQRGDEQAEQVSRAICAAGGVAGAFAADITDEQRVAELVAAITGRFGPVDVLVLNATGPPARGPSRRGRLGRPPRPAELLRQEPGPAGPGHSAPDAGPAVWPDRAHRLGGRPPAASGQVGLCHRQERTDRPGPQLGPRTRSV